MIKSILIISEDRALETSLIDDFERRGYVLVTVSTSDLSSGYLPETAPQAIIVQIGTEIGAQPAAITIIREHYKRPNIPSLALLSATPVLEETGTPVLEETGFDSILIEPCHPAQIFLRTMGLIRINEMEREITLRLQTLEHDFDLKPKLPRRTDNKRFKILFIGKASPEFMLVINALQQEHVRVVAAFTSFTAFDYLYEQTFDAVVMNGMDGDEPAFTVTNTMRKNAKLYHLPALLLVDREKFNNEAQAYKAGINDIIDTKSALDVISSRILEQANFHRLHSNFKHDFNVLGGELCLDSQTGLYNKAYFDAHLTRVCAHFDNMNLPVSLCLIRVKPTNRDDHDTPMSSAYMQIGRMLKNLVRIQDITARIAPNLYAIAFPGQSANQLSVVTDRIGSILKCARFSDPKTGNVIDIELEITLNTLGQVEDETTNAA